MTNRKINKVYINATSINSVCGNTKATLNAIFEQKSGLSVTNRIIADKDVCIGKIPRICSFYDLLCQSVDETLALCDLDDFSTTLLLVGSSVGGMATTERTLISENKLESIDIQKHTIDSIASMLDKRYGFLANRSFSTACTSSANALKTAKELISCGAYANILVVGVDELCLTTIYGFNSLGILSSDICTPFKKGRKGMNVAEGIGVILLQNRPLLNAVELLGVGASSDAHHIANPDPEATGFMLSIQKALDDAGMDASSIDYVNAHGTGTQANDATEAKAIANIFGLGIPVSSIKANIGHTLGASGAIEAIVCVEALKAQRVPLQLDSSDLEEDINVIGAPLQAKMCHLLSNSFAFGGNNVSLVFGACRED